MTHVPDSNEIDKQLKTLRESQELATHNVEILVGKANFAMLDAAQARLTGKTAREAVPPLLAFNKLREAFGQIALILSNAEKIKRTTVFLTESKRQEIADLIFGESVKLPPEQVPAGNLQLMTPHDAVGMTPERFLEVFAAAFTAMNKVVLEVETANDQLGGALDRTKHEVDELTTLGQSLGVPPTELASVLSELEQLKDRSVLDPLGTDVGFTTGIAPLVAAARARLQNLLKQQQQVKGAIDSAATKLVDLKALQQTVNAKLKECRGAIQNPPVQKRRGDLIAALETSLENAKQSRDAGKLAEAVTLMNTFAVDSGTFRDAEQAALDAYNGMLAERIELRERLKTYKARAIRHGVSEEKSLQQVALNAEAILYHRPDRLVLTPLPDARLLVEQYRSLEEQLSSGAK